MIKDALRTIGIYIDVAVYWIVENLFQLIMDLSNVEIFSESIIDEFSSRIYVILGLVMVFKLMISFIQMLINPDKMSDKEQGATSLLKRVIISLALIFLVPSIFDLARQVQGEIVPLIPKVVLGTTVDAADEATADKIGDVGRLMAFYSFSPFFTYQNESCNDGSIMGTGGDDGEADIWSVSSAATYVKEEDNCSTDPDGYKYSYSWPFSTLVGAYLVYVLVSIAVAIAVRTIKLSICELVAPIPIASYIDPKTSKQTFDKWVSTTLKTYADLFIRLIIVYFVIFVFQVLFSGETGIMEQILTNVGGSVFRKGLVVVFIIVGLLQFAKQAPKFLTDMLGLSGTGDYFASMVKGEGWKALGATLGTPAAAIGAGVGNAMYSWKNSGVTKDSKWYKKLGAGATSVARGIGGATAATGRGIVATASGKGLKGSFSDNIRTTTANSQRRVNRGAIARASSNEYNEEVAAHTLRRDNLIARRQQYSDELIVNESENANLRSQLSAAVGRQSTATSEAEYNAAQRDIDRINNEILINERRHGVLENLLSRIPGEIDKENKAISNVARPISPVKNTLSNAFDTFTGMKSVSGASILEASSALSSMRSTYYTGEAMKKLTEEGSKLTEILSMGATYSDVASAYESLRNGSKTEVYINGKRYTDIQQVGELYKTAEKEAAINYINAVKDGRIKNSTIEEGFKQIYGALDGMGLDAKTKNELIADFNKDPGKFLKSLSDISKRLETEGKRRQAYEREQKKSS